MCRERTWYLFRISGDCSPSGPTPLRPPKADSVTPPRRGSCTMVDRAWCLLRGRSCVPPPPTTITLPSIPSSEGTFVESRHGFPRTGVGEDGNGQSVRTPIQPKPTTPSWLSPNWGGWKRQHRRSTRNNSSEARHRVGSVRDLCRRERSYRRSEEKRSQEGREWIPGGGPVAGWVTI